MSIPLPSLILVALATGAFRPAPPWNNSGHRILALRAWAELTPKTRTALGALLRQHPRFGDDLQIGVAADADAATQERLAFALASHWPDTVRSLTHPMHKVANHPAWHYIDVPYVLGDLSPTSEPAKPDQGAANLVQAIRKNVADLADAKLPAADRAIALCWVAHLIPDLHQPMHCCTLYSPQFPHGDRGGTSFYVTREVWDPLSRTSLHTVWDSLLGNYQQTTSDAFVAAGMAGSKWFARERFAKELAVTDVEQWVRESHDLAVEHVYQNGELHGAADAADTKAPPLPLGYLVQAERVAFERGALSALRLADTLNRIFDPK